MAIVKMQRIDLCGLKKDRKEILEKLQAYGTVEINFRKKDKKGMKIQDTSSERADFEKRSVLAETAIGILDKYAPEKTSLLDSLAGKPLLEKSQFQEAIAQQQLYMTQAREIVALEKQLTETYAETAKLQNQVTALGPWLSLDVPMNIQGTKDTTVILGTVGGLVTEERLLTTLKIHQPPVEAADIRILSADKDQTYLTVVCLKQDQNAAEEALREIGFARPSSVAERIPKDEVLALQEEIKLCEKKSEELLQALSDKGSERQHLKVMVDYYQMRADKYEVLGTLPQTKNTFAVSGYIPEKVSEAIQKDLTSKYTVAIEFEAIGGKETAPVLLSNNGFSDCVEGVVESFGLPNKKEFDPTMITSFFYVFLFGLMLSDAAYGALISIVCGVILWKFKRMDASLRKSIKMFFWCGISTLFWGVMFGGYFGDVITVVASTFFGKTVVIKPLWFTPLDDPMRMLVYSLLFGLIHLFTGLALKGYMMLKEKDVLGFFCDVVAWFMFLMGLILMLLPTDMFYSISQMQFNFPPAMQMASKVLTIAGALIILVMSGRRKKKKIGLRLALGLYDLYNITGWLSDVLSYSRLLALGLATGVIAQVVNQMGSMLGGGVIGAIFFIIVFIIGHTFNMAINILGAYVHTNRLQYVEFFGKFYEGGGRKFNPFKAETKYVDIQEEN